MLTSHAEIKAFAQRETSQAVQAAESQGRFDPIAPGHSGGGHASNRTEMPVDADLGCQDKETCGGADKSNGGAVNAKKCQLPGCGLEFTPSTSAKDQRFCTVAHRALYWKLAANIGDKMIREGRCTLLEKREGPFCRLILERLGDTANEWVPKNRILGGIWNSRRITDLRAKGHLIEHRMFQGQSQYRLVVAE